MFLCLVFLMLLCLFIAALWSHAGKGLTSRLLLVMFIVFCYFPVWYPVSGVVPDLCLLSYFARHKFSTNFSFGQVKTRK